MSMRLFVAFPMYQSVPAEVFSRWLEMDHSPVVAHMVTRGAHITAAMNLIVSKALERDDWDRLLTFESDMIPPKDSLLRIAQYGPEHDVVGSIYFQHVEPYEPLVFFVQPDLSFTSVPPQTIQDWCDKPDLYQCDMVGFGYTSIARRVLQDWDPSIPLFNTDGQISHDLWFCHQARQQGYHVYVDSGIVCDHLTSVPVGLSHGLSTP